MKMKVGLARHVITPQHSMTMAGFASRELPSEGIEHDLWAKAMAIADEDGAQTVIVCIDLILVTTVICEAIAQKIEQKYGIARDALVFNASHTHSGPTLAHPMKESLRAETMADFEIHEERIRTYSAWLVEALADVIGQALEDLQTAHLEFGNGKANFAVNRRQLTPTGWINGSNPDGVGDPDVPVLKVTAPDGAVRGAVWLRLPHDFGDRHESAV